MNNVSSFGNPKNNQGEKTNVGCIEKINECWSSTPLFCRFIFWTCTILFLLSFFFPVQIMLMNEASLVYTKFHIWRIITAPFVGNHFFTITLSLLIFISRGIQNEKNKGTIKFFINFWWMSIISQIILVILDLLISRITKVKGYSFALWSLVMVDMTIDSYQQPDVLRTCFCIPIQIKSRYFPYIFMVICIFCHELSYPFISGYLTGVLYAYGKLNFTEPSDRCIEIVHKLIFRYYETDPAFISQNRTSSDNSAGAIGLPMFVGRAQQEQNNTNQQNESNANSTNTTANQPTSSFEAFKGRGVSLGTVSYSQNQSNSYSNSNNAYEELKGPNPNVKNSKLIKLAESNNDEVNETVNSNDSNQENEGLL